MWIISSCYVWIDSYLPCMQHTYTYTLTLIINCNYNYNSKSKLDSRSELLCMIEWNRKLTILINIKINEITITDKPSEIEHWRSEIIRLKYVISNDSFVVKFILLYACVYVNKVDLFQWVNFQCDGSRKIPIYRLWVFVLGVWPSIQSVSNVSNKLKHLCQFCQHAWLNLTTINLSIEWWNACVNSNK